MCEKWESLLPNGTCSSVVVVVGVSLGQENLGAPHVHTNVQTIGAPPTHIIHTHTYRETGATILCMCVCIDEEGQARYILTWRTSLQYYTHNDTNTKCMPCFLGRGSHSPFSLDKTQLVPYILYLTLCHYAQQTRNLSLANSYIMYVCNYM